MKCVHCGVDTVSAMELRLNLCLTCIERRTADYVNQIGIKDSVLIENDKLKKLLDVSNKKAELYEGFMKAERAGNIAAENGLPEDQNPYPAGTDENIMWLAGWTTIDTRRKSLQAAAVLSWSVDSLFVISELAHGYDQHEIAAKLDVVIEKCGKFVI